MFDAPLTPLRFEPLFKPAIWGGYRLFDFHGATPTTSDPVGESWVLSDQGENSSRVTDGPLAGVSLRDLMAAVGPRVLGRCADRSNGRFPVLLKFLDTLQPLSVQVHPDDAQARKLAPAKADDVALGKTEAWVVLDAEPDALLYAGLLEGTDHLTLERALEAGTVDEVLHAFAPEPGDCVLLPAGTVHAIGAGLMLFEVQQTSDLTYRLFDWNRVDERTGRGRQLHVAESLFCTDFAAGPVSPRTPRPVATRPAGGRGEELARCDYFALTRWTLTRPTPVGAPGECRILVAIGGSGTLAGDGAEIELSPGAVVLLPAEAGPARAVPLGSLTLLEVALPVG